MNNLSVICEIDTEMDALSPPPFYGNKKDTMTAEAWIRDAECYAAIKKTDLHMLCPLLLKGTARQWLDTLDAATAKDSKKLIEAFTDKFKKNEDDIMDMTCDLTNLRQGNKSISEFLEEFNKLKRQVKMKDKEAVKLAKRQLSPPYNTQLCLQTFNTMEELEEAALSLERSLTAQSATVNATSSTAQPTMESIENLMPSMATRMTQSFSEAITTAINTAVNAQNVSSVRFPDDRGRSHSPSQGNARPRDSTPHRSKSPGHNRGRQYDSRNGYRRDPQQRRDYRDNSKSRQSRAIARNIIQQCTSMSQAKQAFREENVCQYCGEYRSKFNYRDHSCSAKNIQCRNCQITGHYQDYCMQKYKQ